MRYLTFLLLLGCSETSVKSPSMTYYCNEYYTAADGITGLSCKLYKENEPLYKQETMPYIFIKNKDSYGF